MSRSSRLPSAASGVAPASSLDTIGESMLRIQRSLALLQETEILTRIDGLLSARRSPSTG